MNDESPNGGSTHQRSTARRACIAAAVAFAVGAAAWGGGLPGRAELAFGAGGGAETGDICALFDHSHEAWSDFLGRYVSDAGVDYARIEREGRAELNAYLESLQSVCRGHYEQWPRSQQLAYWLNAYNAYTIELILEYYPIDSIRSIGWLPYAAFRKSFIPLAAADMGTLSLGDIEHKILRRRFTETRIHFAIVCASKGCPALRTEAYDPERLEQQLDAAARGFIRDPSKNRYDAGSRTLSLSPIFDWFREDFEAAAGTLTAYVTEYMDEAAATALKGAGEVDVEFLDYDWSLNGS